MASKKTKAEQAQEDSGAPVPGGTQVSESAGPARRTQDAEGNPVPGDEQLLEPESKAKGHKAD